jgi:hypothetical protein
VDLGSGVKAAEEVYLRKGQALEAKG